MPVSSPDVHVDTTLADDTQASEQVVSVDTTGKRKADTDAEVIEDLPVRFRTLETCSSELGFRYFNTTLKAWLYDECPIATDNPTALTVPGA